MEALQSPKKSRRPRNGVLIPGVVLILIVASVGGVYTYQKLFPGPSCASPLGTAKMLTTQLQPPTTFGGVTEFALPTPIRAPNGVLVAPDGSVWFGEQAVEGLGHFFPQNRTLVEYAWPFSYPAPPSPGGLCGDKTDIWGIAIWDGKVWASDPTGNQLVGLDPSNGDVTTVKLPTNSSFPYTLTSGPNGTLWFPELFSAKMGELSANGTLREYPLPGGINAEPSQIVFANSTTGLYSDVGQGADKGGVYSFNPAHFAPTLLGNQKLNDPSSLTIASGAVWVALHGSSSIGCYNFTTKAWSYYPTTPVAWNPTTLPYFVDANGSSVWFNEHYGNRIGLIDPTDGTLAEFSESSKSVVNGSLIGNTLTFGLGGGKAWFTEWTGNVLGYVDASYNPGFSTSVSGNSTLVVPSGSNASVTFVVHDTTHTGPLSLTFADSESLTSVPSNLTFSAPSNSFSPPQGGDSSVKVTVAAKSIAPGTYTAILTVSDGLTFESSFVKIVVPS